MITLLFLRFFGRQIMKFHQIPIDIPLYADTLVTLITRKGKPILGYFSGFPDFRLSLDKRKAVCGRATGSLLCRLDHFSIGMYIDHFLVGEFVPPSPPPKSPPHPQKSHPHSGGDSSDFSSKKVTPTVGVTPRFSPAESPPESPLLWG